VSTVEEAGTQGLGNDVVVTGGMAGGGIAVIVGGGILLVSAGAKSGLGTGDEGDEARHGLRMGAGEDEEREEGEWLLVEGCLLFDFCSGFTSQGRITCLMLLMLAALTSVRNRRTKRSLKRPTATYGEVATTSGLASTILAHPQLSAPGLRKPTQEAVEWHHWVLALEVR